MSTITEIFSRTGATNAIALLKEDHQKVKGIFDEFEKACEEEDAERCRTLAEKALLELTVHARIEEEIFYPAVRAKIEDEDLLDEAQEEHHAAKLLITELVSKGLKGERWEAKFTVLSEMVKHHIKEEEGELLPEAGKVGFDFEQMGERMLARKKELTEQLDSLPALKRFEERLEARTRARGSRRKAARPAARRTPAKRGGARRSGSTSL